MGALCLSAVCSSDFKHKLGRSRVVVHGCVGWKMEFVAFCEVEC